MASIAEIFEIEKDRQDSAKWNVIHLFKEGSFYHAYEWSAWLVSEVAYNDEVRQQTQDRKPLSVTHKRVKNTDGTFAFVGFPLNSLDKYIPQSCQMDFKAVSDTQLDIYIELPTDLGELDEETISAKVEEWKQLFPVKEDKKKQKGDQAQQQQLSQRPMGMAGICSQVLAYPLEKKSPVEVVDFVSDLKRQLAALF